MKNIYDFETLPKASIIKFECGIVIPDSFDIMSMINDFRPQIIAYLFAKEYAFCASKKETIISKTKSVIRFQKRTGDVLFAYCNFNLLETRMLEWK